MGMYTGLRGKVVLNDLGVQLSQTGFEWSSSLNDLVAKFGLSDDRSCFIPYGALCYMPDEWGEQLSAVIGSTWSFSCSLKNYDSTIKRFIDEVLPLIAVSWQLETLYEEDDTPTSIINEGAENVE